MIIRTYSDLIRFSTFEERYEYLKLSGVVGKSTFGFDRYLNQLLYNSCFWKSSRDKVIIRDQGCDLGVEGYDINDRIYVHHINPVTIEDIDKFGMELLDPEFLICTSFRTHNAIHFGDANQLPKPPIERKPGDTCPWR